MSNASNQRNMSRQNNLRSQLGRMAQRGNNIPELLQQAQQQGNGEKINRILRSSGISSDQLRQALTSNSNNRQAVQNIIQQVSQGNLPQGALLVLNQDSLLLINAPEGTLLAASDQGFLLGGENDNDIIAANDEGILYVQDNQSGNADIYQYNNGAPNGQYNADYQAGTWGDDQYAPVAQTQRNRFQSGYNWEDNQNYNRPARRDRRSYNAFW